jgi:hypothetical protein
VGNDDRRMSGWEEGEEGESRFEPELAGWCALVGHGVGVVNLIGNMTSISVV